VIGPPPGEPARLRVIELVEITASGEAARLRVIELVEITASG
jgi:hypothetical protein